MLITDFAQVLRAEQMWFWWDTAVGDADGNWQFHHINKRLSPEDDASQIEEGYDHSLFESEALRQS